MSQQSEKRVADQSPARLPDGDEPSTARVLPFERPQSEVQRAIQQRAQETIERENARRKFKPTPMRWAVILAAASIPVLLTFGAVDGILRAMHMMNAMYEKEDAERAKQAPPVQESVAEPQEPGVVLLQPFENPPIPATPAPEAASRKSPPSDTAGR